MRMEDARAAWRSGDGGGSEPGIDPGLLALVRARAEDDVRTIRRRDLRELVACGVVALLLLPVLWHPAWLSRVGAGLVIAGCGLIAVMLRRTRRAHPVPRPDGPIARVLEQERARVEAQIRLLSSVLWWYILPIGVGAILVFAGARGVGGWTLAYTVLVVVLGLGVYHLNRKAVRAHFEPRRRELDRLLAHLREESPDE